MATGTTADMSDQSGTGGSHDRRALLTEREREIVSGEADVTDPYRYQTISRIRRRMQKIEDDLAALDGHDTLGDEFRSLVCDDREDDEKNDT
jgi:hypothetical protein